MKIIFNNGKEFEYIHSFGIEKDYHEGETRPSLEITIPVTATSFSEIEDIVSNPDNVFCIILIGDETPIYKEDENGKVYIDGYYIPENTYTGFTMLDFITKKDNTISFKLYKKSVAELELETAIETIAELLVSMEG